MTRFRQALIAGVLSVLVGLGALQASFVLVPLPERLTAPGSQVVQWRDGTAAHVFLAPDDRWRVPVAVDEVDPDYVAALLHLEDRRFYLHPGVDPIALVRAASSNLLRGRRVSGGSTLTMQLVRVLEPRPRTLRSKAVEAWRALQLERHLTKDEVLAAYLNFAPYGRNVEGVAAASLAWFGHGPDHLSAAEIATLLAVPQAPSSRHPSPRNAERLRAGRDTVAGRLVEAGALPLQRAGVAVTGDALLDEIRGAAVPVSMGRLPRAVPQVAIWLRQRHPDQPRLHTTLDRGLQAVAERHLDRGARELSTRGVHNGVAILLDHGTGEVVALAGNLAGEGPGREVPMFAVPRSPGSALKPFIFARAVDRGLALPEQLVPDVPASYGGYAPSNYDGRFDGLVRLDEALSRSLNLPFVHLLQEIGLEDFLGQLRAADVDSLIDTPGWYGLSAAVGGVELTALELIGLYASLARGGRHLPVRLLDPGAPREEGVRLQSEGASWLTRRVLSQRDRPDFPSRRHYVETPARVHWKTGTSFGHRDAWAVGSGPVHTALIWYGNADQTGSVALVGADAAGGPLFDLLEQVGDPKDRHTVDVRPSDLVQIEVCAFSGYLPVAGCETKAAWALRHAVPTRSCPYTVQVEVDAQTGEAVLPGCRGERETRTETYVVLPASVRRWMSGQHRRAVAPPPLAAACAGRSGGKPPRIVLPAADEVVLLLSGVPADRQEVPLQADGEAATLHWFVDGAYLGAASAEERMWWTPAPGRHEVVVRDEGGRSSRRTFEVRMR